MKSLACKVRALVLLFALAFLPYATANAISAACSNFSTSSFSGLGAEVFMGTTNYAVGPFLPGDYLTIRVGWIIPAIAGYIPHDSFSLVDANGIVLSGPSIDPYAPLTYQVQGTISSIGVKNIGTDLANVSFASCVAAPTALATAPVLQEIGLVALLILLVVVARFEWWRRAKN